MNEYTVREFNPETDYPGVDSVLIASFDDYPFIGERLRHMDNNPDKRIKRKRWVCSASTSELVGIGEYSQRPANYHPRKFFVMVAVKPEHRNRGIGGRLYETVTTALDTYDPLSLLAATIETSDQSLEFMAKRGYVESMRLSRSFLDVIDFDFARFAALEEKLKDRGIVIRSYTSLADDPERDQKLYELEQEACLDIPFPEPFQRMSFEQWKESALHIPDLVFDALFIAVDTIDNSYIGMTATVHNEEPRRLHTQMTGVARSHRKMGIATAIKLELVRYAQAHRYPKLGTNNSEYNNGMLAVNEALGFTHDPAIIFMTKTLKEE